MGYIKEPNGIDLVVGPSELTETDTMYIRDAIATYKSNKPKARSTPIKIKSLIDKYYAPGSYISQPKTLAIKANDGKIHLFKVTPVTRSVEALLTGAAKTKKA